MQEPSSHALGFTKGILSGILSGWNYCSAGSSTTSPSGC